jgi:hypothetical protein
MNIGEVAGDIAVTPRARTVETIGTVAGDLALEKIE